MAAKKKRRPHPDTEAALIYAVKHWRTMRMNHFVTEPLIHIFDGRTSELVVRLDLRKVIARRAPLRGIKAATRGVAKVVNARGKK